MRSDESQPSHPPAARDFRDELPSRYQLSSMAAPATLLIMLTAFGPYLSRTMGLRAEHVVIYLTAPLFIFPLCSQARHISILHPAVLILALLAAALIWTGMTTMLGGFAPVSANVRLSSFENALQPILVIVVAFVAVHRRPSAEILNHLNRLLILFIGIMVANTLVAVSSVVIDISPMMRYFTRSEEATWFAAITGARLSGLFSQPAEQGAAISLALLAWGYRWRTGRVGFWNSSLILLLLVFGGIIGLSKIFFVGGTTLFVLLVGPVSTARLVLAPRSLLAIAGLGIAAVVAIPQGLRGLPLLQVWFDADSPVGLIRSLSSGRFGSGSDYFVQRTFLETWHTSPVFGFGFGYSQLLDNGFLEFFLQGGLIALAAYSTILILLLGFGIANRGADPILSRLVLAMTVLVIGGNLGVPVVSINRFAPCFWTILVTSLCAMHRIRRERNRGRDV